jgi:Flp pilus assembly protein TadG
MSGQSSSGPVSVGRLKAERGQDLVEFALIFPILFLVLMGIFDLGRATYYTSALYNAAREGARYGIIFPDDVPGIESAVEFMAVGITSEELVIAVAYPSDDTVQVTVSWDMPIVTPLIGALFEGANTVTLGSQATMTIEE